MEGANQDPEGKNPRKCAKKCSKIKFKKIIIFKFKICFVKSNIVITIEKIIFFQVNLPFFTEIS